jgi:carboxylate-amine ligase
VICGCHVHVGIDDPDLAIAVMNRATPFLGAILALASNSPFWRGLDTGYASYRTQVWERWPTAGLPPVLDDRTAYDHHVALLREIDAIDDASYLYWHVRPAARYPTLEFRIGDVMLRADDAAGYAALIRALVWTLAREVVSGRPPRVHVPEPDLTTAAIWRAARYGIDEQLVSPGAGELRPAADVLWEVVEHCGDGLLAHGDADLVTSFVSRMLAEGNGAMRQRRSHAQGGGTGAVVELVLAETVSD